MTTKPTKAKAKKPPPKKVQVKRGPSYIYALVCPETDRVRYIGKTVNPRRRHQQHIRDSKRSGSAKDRWVSALLLKGKSPRLIILEETQDWQAAERKWIASYGLCNLLNVAEGGVPDYMEKTRRAGKWHRKVIARFLEIAKASDRTQQFRAIAQAYRDMRDQARRHGREDEYELFLEARFGEALS